MLNRLSKDKKRKFLLQLFVAFPVSFGLSILIVLWIVRFFEIKLTLGDVIFVVSGTVLICGGIIINHYRKLLKEE